MKLTKEQASRAHLLVYDIPTNSKLANPSPLLWGLGARINLSAWIIPDACIVQLPLDDWKAHGASVELVRFDESDKGTILRLARESLERHLGEIRESTERNMQAALAKLEVVATGDADAVKKRRASASVVTWRAKRDLERAMECALTFDLTAEVAHLFDAARHTIAAQEQMAFDAVKKKLTAGQQEVA